MRLNNYNYFYKKVKKKENEKHINNKKEVALDLINSDHDMFEDELLRLSNRNKFFLNQSIFFLTISIFVLFNKNNFDNFNYILEVLVKVVAVFLEVGFLLSVRV